MMGIFYRISRVTIMRNLNYYENRIIWISLPHITRWRRWGL